jgi:Uma2 family endonuclease
MGSPDEHHGFVCWVLSLVLGAYVVRRVSGCACSNDTGLVVQNDPDTVRDPDLIFFTESRGLDELSRKGSTRIPAPVVEVQSPTDRYGRILRRIEPYHKRGVPLVWLVDPEERTVTAFTPNEFPKMHDETEQLTGNGVLPGFACRVSELFALPGQPPAPPSEFSVPIGKEPT